MADGTFFNVAREIVLPQGLDARRSHPVPRRSVELYPSAPDGCVAVVREPGFDEYGAKVIHRIYRKTDGCKVVTTRDYYDRDGSVTDYEVTSAWFADLALALKAVGVEPEGAA